MMTVPEETKRKNGGRRGWLVELWECVTDLFSRERNRPVGRQRSKSETLWQFLREYKRLPTPAEIEGWVRCADDYAYLTDYLAARPQLVRKYVKICFPEMFEKKNLSTKLGARKRKKKKGGDDDYASTT